MGRAVIGGVITSTLLTLVVVPVLYTYLDGWSERMRARRAAKAAAAAEAAAAPPAHADSRRAVQRGAERKELTGESSVTCDDCSRE